MNYGFIKDKIEEDHWVLGGGHIPQKVIVNPSGDWSDYLPVFEAQASKFETWGCTVFGTLNCLESLLKCIKLEESNFSERFPYIGNQIREPGTSPHKVAEWIRENGLVEQDTLPMTDAYDDFIKPDPLPVNMLIEGQHFLNEWDFKHEWIACEDENIKSKLKTMLKYSPLGVSVHAWKKNGRVYIKDEGDEDNHWTMLYKIDDKGYYHIFDSYEGTKVLSPDYKFGMAKVYFLFKRTEPRDATKNVYVGILKRLIGFLKELFNMQTLEELKKKSMNEKLYELAKSKLGTDFTPDWVVSDDVSCAFALTTILKELVPEMPIIVNTGELYRFMKSSPLFEEIPQPITKIEKGTIIVAPTGMNSRPDIMPNGHCFIAGENEKYMSNSSYDGLWSENYTRETARQRYVYKGGFPLFVFRLK